jgi:hypothetical protein
MFLSNISAQPCRDCLRCVCLILFTKERNKKERDSKTIGYFYGLYKEINKEGEKYNG